LTGDKKTIKGSITFVDLAGCEKFNDKNYDTDSRFDEAVFINSSLTALGRVVLAKTRNESHIPYRDNKLTRLIEPHLEQGSIVTLLVMMNPVMDNFEFCVDSGAFATRCKEICTSPKQNIKEEHNEELVTEKDLLGHEQESLKNHIEKIKFDIKYATQKEYEQQMYALDGMYKKKFEDLKTILKLDYDLELVIDSFRNNTNSEAMKQLNNKIQAFEELKRYKLKSDKLQGKLDKILAETNMVKAETAQKNDKNSSEFTVLKLEISRLKNEMEQKEKD